MKKPSTEKVIIVHRPQKPASQERVAAENVTVDCGTQMLPSEPTTACPPQEEQTKES